MSISCSNWHLSSSRNRRSTPRIDSAGTITVSSPRLSRDLTQSGPRTVSTCWASSSSMRWRLSSTAAGVRLAFYGSGTPNLALQQQHAVDQRLCRRWTPRHIDIDWHDPVAAADDGIGVVVVAPAVGAASNRYDIPWLGHLVVNLAQVWRHLVAQRTCHDLHVGFARRGTGRKAKAFKIPTRHRGLHHLDGAAGKSEGHPHQRAGARPIDEVVGGCDQEPLVGELSGDLAEGGRSRP